jgi:hypothetical protein
MWKFLDVHLKSIVEFSPDRSELPCSADSGRIGDQEQVLLLLKLEIQVKILCKRFVGFGVVVTFHFDD